MNAYSFSDVSISAMPKFDGLVLTNQKEKIVDRMKPHKTELITDHT